MRISLLHVQRAQRTTRKTYRQIGEAGQVHFVLCVASLLNSPTGLSHLGGASRHLGHSPFMRQSRKSAASPKADGEGAVVTQRAGRTLPPCVRRATCDERHAQRHPVCSTYACRLSLVPSSQLFSLSAFQLARSASLPRKPTARAPSLRSGRDGARPRFLSSVDWEKATTGVFPCLSGTGFGTLSFSPDTVSFDSWRF